MTKVSTIALIGATGFIGRHLLESLAGAPWRLRVMVHGGAPSWLGRLASVEAVPGDLFDSPSIDRVIAEADVVVNLAGQVSDDVDDYQAVNLRGTLALAARCARHGIRRVVHASSALVYGDALDANEYSPCRPITPYATMKLAAEEILRGTLPSDSRLLLLRLSNVYGPNQVKGLVPYLIRCLRDRRRVTIDADGAQVRDFVHVRDVASAVAAAITAPCDGAVNIGSGSATSVMAVLRMLEDVLDTPATGQYRPEHTGGERRSTVNVAKAAQCLGWHACTTLREGLEEIAGPVETAAAAR